MLQDENKPFSKREWFFLIALIVLIQFIAQWLSFEYKDSSNALGYVSFAGTIVSIILAVLAIIYSYIQSASQQSSSEKITSQVDKLVDVVSKIDTSKISFSTELSKLKDINDKIDKTMSSQQEISVNVSKLHGRIDQINPYSKINPVSERQKLGDTEELYEKPLASGVGGLSLVSIGLYFAEKSKKSVNQVLTDYLNAYWVSKIKTKSEKIRVASYNEGYLTASCHMLLAFDLMSLDSKEDGDDGYDFDNIPNLNEAYRLDIELFIDFMKEEAPENKAENLLCEFVDFCESTMKTQ